jgi:predicted ATPase
MRIEKLEFKSGTDASASRLVVEPKKITVFIGPNNGGKSAALGEILQACANGSRPSKIFHDIVHSRPNETNVDRYIERFTLSAPPSHPSHIVIGYRGNRHEINAQDLRNQLLANGGPYSPYLYGVFLQHFVLNLGGENRLGLVGGGGAQNLRDVPQSTIATIFMDDALRAKISAIVHDAFGHYLVIDPTSMSSLQYGFSDTYPADHLSRSFGPDAIDFFSKCTPVSSTSDGTRAFVGIVTEVTAGAHDILVLDEPEAFLHPALAYALGREITKNVTGEKQMFVSTHSSHFLMGCMSVGAEVDIIRLTYKGGRATARRLASNELRKMMNDPLLRSIGVMNALFFDSAVVVEADSDRAFYEEINSRINLYSTGGAKHSVFLNAHNKTEAAHIARVLRNVGIPASIILDIDWIKEDGKVSQRYMAAAGVPKGLRAGLTETRRQVRASLDETQGDYKTTGGIAKLSGDELATANSFFDEMERYGLFTVRVGELEHWLPELGVKSRKDQWLGDMFRRLGSDTTDAGYVLPQEGDVWRFVRGVAKWVDNPQRQGMAYVDPAEL